MRKIVAFKGILWFLLGLAATVTVFRFWKGLGPTTNLTDLTPWGFWIGFDVMGGVALAAGGFVVAATVYVFHLDKYHGIVRPAVLTAFLGYLAVVGGLMFDLGLPWHIFNMIVFWNPHSPLFEVGWCVMLYLTVLALEFAPVVLEMAKHPLLQKIYKVVKRATLPLVILGIMLSSLHQSSLGSLFLIMPHRLHPLWYTPWLPVLFFISAVGLGLCMVQTEALFTSWLYDQEPEKPQLKGLAKAAAWVLWFVLAARLADLAWRGEIATMFAGGFAPNLFLFELAISLVIPAILFSIPAVRDNIMGLRIASGMAVIGFVLNRLDVGGLAMIETTGTRYLPSWMEVSVSVGVVSAAALVFFFIAENFHLWHVGPMKASRFKYTMPKFNAATGIVVPDPYWPGLKRYTAMVIAGAALGAAFMPEWAFSGNAYVKSPVHAPAYGDVIIIDGNLNDKAVRFDHKGHVDYVAVAGAEGEKACAYCHHMVPTGARATGCSKCHRDENLPTNIFDHDLHADLLAEGPGCETCHRSPDEPKDLEHAKPCMDCHTAMVPEGAAFKPRAYPNIGLAAGYMDAMHGLCDKCHEEQDKEMGGDLNLGKCSTCHSGAIEAFDPMKPDSRGKPPAVEPKADEPKADEEPKAE